MHVKLANIEYTAQDADKGREKLWLAASAGTPVTLTAEQAAAVWRGMLDDAKSRIALDSRLDDFAAYVQ